MWSPRSIRSRWNSIYTSNERPTCRQGEVAVANREGREEIKVAGRPASTFVEISRLASDDFLVKIEAVALLPS